MILSHEDLTQQFRYYVARSKNEPLDYVVAFHTLQCWSANTIAIELVSNSMLKAKIIRLITLENEEGHVRKEHLNLMFLKIDNLERGQKNVIGTYTVMRILPQQAATYRPYFVEFLDDSESKRLVGAHNLQMAAETYLTDIYQIDEEFAGKTVQVTNKQDEKETTRFLIVKREQPFYLLTQESNETPKKQSKNMITEQNNSRRWNA